MKSLLSLSKGRGSRNRWQRILEVKRVLVKCLVCQRQRFGAGSPKMAPLPTERGLFSLTFTHFGIDFAGPLYVQEDPSPHKSYLCIFTCASSRIAHLELTSDLSTNAFLQAFNHMISRRGLCSIIWSDKANTFKCADRQIRKLYKTQSKVINPISNSVGKVGRMFRHEPAVEDSYELPRDWTFNLATPPRTLLSY